MIKEVWIDRAQWNDLPWRFEPGTPPIAEAVGLTAAIEYLEKLGMERVAEHERALARQARRGAGAIPGVTVYGPPAAVERGAVVAFSVDGLHPHDVAALLDAEGIAVRAGHHCAQPLMRCLRSRRHRARELLRLQLARGRLAPRPRRGRACARAL